MRNFHTFTVGGWAAGGCEELLHFHGFTVWWRVGCEEFIHLHDGWVGGRVG